MNLQHTHAIAWTTTYLRDVEGRTGKCVASALVGYYYYTTARHGHRHDSHTTDHRGKWAWNQRLLVVIIAQPIATATATTHARARAIAATHATYHVIATLIMMPIMMASECGGAGSGRSSKPPLRLLQCAQQRGVFGAFLVWLFAEAVFSEQGSVNPPHSEL